MANESIRLTFSEDGEHLQLSRLDAAMLLTWILGGDHDGDIPSTAFTGEPSAPPTFGGIEFEIPAFGHQDDAAEAQEFVPAAVLEQVEEIWTTENPFANPPTQLHTEPPAVVKPVTAPVATPPAVKPEAKLPTRQPRVQQPLPVQKPQPPVEVVDPGDFWTNPVPEELNPPKLEKPAPEPVPSEKPIASYEITPEPEPAVVSPDETPYWELEDELAPQPPQPNQR